MIKTQWIRWTLWLSCPFNLLAAGLFAMPGSYASQLVGIPPSAPPIYTALTAFLITLFSATYAWMAL
jgi:hypothetical protein